MELFLALRSAYLCRPPNGDRRGESERQTNELEKERREGEIVESKRSICSWPAGRSKCVGLKVSDSIGLDNGQCGVRIGSRGHGHAGQSHTNAKRTTIFPRLSSSECALPIMSAAPRRRLVIVLHFVDCARLLSHHHHHSNQIELARIGLTRLGSPSPSSSFFIQKAHLRPTPRQGRRRQRFDLALVVTFHAPQARFHRRLAHLCELPIV